MDEVIHCGFVVSKALTLGESYHENEINSEEAKKISPDHFVNHHHEWTDDFEASILYEQ
jgi:hypothetical protein